MRTFNCFGPVYEDEHYCVKRVKEILELKKKIDSGRYFSIFAPRQMGKTTFFKQLFKELKKYPYYIGIALDFEMFSNLHVEVFYSEVQEEINEQLLRRLEDINCEKLNDIKNFISNFEIKNHLDFRKYFDKLGRIIKDKKIVIIIDEFDGIPQSALSDFLYTLRSMYNQRKSGGFGIYSIGLVGVRNIADLNIGKVSPFNIADKFEIKNFNFEQVKDLLSQYTEETGQSFDKKVISAIYEQTCGHPFLVNRIALILTEELDIPKTVKINQKHFEEGLKKILLENSEAKRSVDLACKVGERLKGATSDNFLTLYKNAENYKDYVLKVIFGDPIKFNPKNKVIRNLLMYGIVKEKDGFCEISNPIYKKWLIMAFQPFENSDAEYYFNEYLSQDKLNMDSVFEEFKDFMERIGLNLFKITEYPKESVGQYMLLSYLDLLVKKQSGYSYIEVPSGIGRLDILLLYKNKKYIVETKIWRGKKELEKSKLQLLEYLKSEKVDKGYLIIFNHRTKVKKSKFEEKFKNYLIKTYIVNISPKPPSKIRS